MGISNWIERIRQDPHKAGAFEITLEAAHRVISPSVEAALLLRGFEAVAPLKWLRFDGSPVRQMFAFPSWKGGVISPRWGLSLDFVPHVTGSSVRWHRTNKSAVFDLAVDARDKSMDVSLIRGEQAALQSSAAIVERAVARADEFWRRVHSVEDVVGAFEWLRGYLSTGGLGFYSYVQHPVALAFVLARTGNLVGARQELGAYVNC
ncbi:hypothetical protein [Paraburkholderia terrae]|uniref:hypothetical protein n=1 Tax=Paraburkholderia terrae TaxID=311230 RepID=UPI001EE2F4DF|nr:hypothetical protein [Paraburkholderia terrae]GJH05705.1 hypothetical protein CBA19C8_34130 [Paraburkholderia terrae]